MRRLVRKTVFRLLRWMLTPVVNDIRLRTPLIWGRPDRVVVHPTAAVHNALFNVISGRITVEAHAFFGHNVCLLTGRHDVKSFDEDRQYDVPTEGCDITIRRGAWVASNAIVLGPCEIGSHAVVAAGSVVTRDVPPGHVVAGNPARVIRRLPLQSQDGSDREPDGPPASGVGD